MEITVDFSQRNGTIRPIHGFNNTARKTGYSPLLDDFVSLQPPIIRLHDTCGFYGGTHYVDIPNIFPDFEADPDEESSYDFTLTDAYIKPIVEMGALVMYRLGVTIEHAPKKYRVFPPSSPEKWADICEHIVRHYNDGWANGHHWNIRYWEIWNEPDGLHPDIEPFGPPMWNGTAQQYYRLYSLTANKIKTLHPEVMVGGYSSCYILGAFTGKRWEEGPTAYFTDFLTYIGNEATKAPLDFFSYHGYLGKNYIGKIEKEYTFVKNTLRAYGFEYTEIHNTEWNTNIAFGEPEDRRTEYYINMRNEHGAAHAAAALFEMNRLGMDYAMFYDAQLWWEYGCIFDVPSLRPTKTYYAFAAYSDLYGLRNSCPVFCPDGLYACAATGETDMLGVANVSEQTRTVVIKRNGKDRTAVTVTETAGDRTNEVTLRQSPSQVLTYDIRPSSFITVRWE